MQTKPLVYGIVGFLIGGLLVSIAAMTFDSPDKERGMNTDMVTTLQNKEGDAFDEVFVSEMIAHHQDAVDMAKLSKDRAKHKEVKDLSEAIISAQEQEIAKMKQWQTKWGYEDMTSPGM